ncbi:uracil-DNA glycosylase [Halobacteriales archaeon QS_1_68_20]|nr:MAG: uracil-DNA glycosylase [Halobacteriales archaeon QS_1_68_20]
MENVTDRTSNPFGMRAPCETRCSSATGAVYGYGDANADFHVIGDYPGVHGCLETGVPFTGSVAGERLQSVLHEVGFADGPYADEPDYENLFTSYRYMCCTPDGDPPSDADYDLLERYFDAELRAINAHVLLPVGERATDRVLWSYTTLSHKVDGDPGSLHATERRGRGFMVIPIVDPAEWDDAHRAALVGKLEDVLASDYRQTKGVATLVG